METGELFAKLEDTGGVYSLDMKVFEVFDVFQLLLTFTDYYLQYAHTLRHRMTGLRSEVRKTVWPSLSAAVGWHNYSIEQRQLPRMSISMGAFTHQRRNLFLCLNPPFSSHQQTHWTMLPTFWKKCTWNRSPTVCLLQGHGPSASSLCGGFTTWRQGRLQLQLLDCLVVYFQGL